MQIFKALNYNPHITTWLLRRSS